MEMTKLDSAAIESWEVKTFMCLSLSFLKKKQKKDNEASNKN